MFLAPSSRPINAVTKADWEGTGVKPDVNVPADASLAVGASAHNGEQAR